MFEPEIDEKPLNKRLRYTMKARRTKTEAKPITITVERLSDKSRITFTISSDKTIEQLRALLNHHLPPLSPDKFDLYSYQRGALIHFHPSSFKLDYFPVIFDQSVLLLKMDDQLVENNNSVHTTPTNNRKQSKKERYSLLNEIFPSKSNKTTTTMTTSSPKKSAEPQSSSSSITCLSLLKQIFHQSSSSTQVNTHGQSNILTY